VNGLSLNPDKSEAILIGTGATAIRGSLNVIDLGDIQILTSECVHSLGVMIDNTLSFSTRRQCMQSSKLPSQGSSSNLQPI